MTNIKTYTEVNQNAATSTANYFLKAATEACYF